MMKKMLLSIFALVMALMLCTLPALATTPDEDPDLEYEDEWKVMPMKGYTDEQVAKIEEELALRATAWPSHGVPGEGHMPLLEAVEISNKALVENKSMTATAVEASSLLPYFLTEDSYVNIGGEPVTLTAPYWQMNYEGSGFYTVYMDAKTGDVITIAGIEDANG